MSEKVIVPAIVFDTLHFASLAFGGITTGRFCQPHPADDWKYNLNCPNCAHGLLMAADGAKEPYQSGSLSDRLMDAGVGGGRSDEAVIAIRWRKNVRTGRVSFGEWCEELSVVRGD